MPSQPNSQSSQGGPVLLELAKYSYATVPMNSVGPIPWVHISNTSSLVAHFETRRSFNSEGGIVEKAIFKVLKDPDVMEEIDLHALGREARRAIEVSKDAMQHTMDQNVAVIIRAPVIAIKYPCSEREVRRFQIRFPSNEHFYDAMKLFSRADVTTVEAGTFPSRRPQTSASYGSPSGTIATQNQTIARPTTAASPSTVLSASTSVLLPSTTTSVMPPPSRHSAPGNPTNVRSSYFEHGWNADLSPERSAPSACLPNRAASEITPGAPPASSPQAGAYKEYVSLASSDRPTVNSNAPHASSRELMSHIGQETPLIDLYTPRPSTAPDKYSQHLSQILPPKRILPFEAITKPPSSREPLKELRNGRRYSTERSPIKRGKDGDENVTHLETAGESQESSRPTKKTRRAPVKATTKPAAPRKPRAARKPASKAPTKSASLSASRAKRADTPVPSGEDFLDRDEIQTESHSIIEDTQALLDRAAATLRGSSAKKAVEVRKSPTAVTPPVLRTYTLPNGPPELTAFVEPQASRPSMADSLAETDLEAPVELPADQPVEASVTSALEPLLASDAPPVTAIESTKTTMPFTPANERHDLAPSTLLQVSGTTGSSTTPSVPLAPTAVSVPTTPTVVPNLNSLTDQFQQTYTALLSRPEFANSDTKLDAWANQPKHLRTRATRKFICDAYGSPNFAELCKEIAGDWRPLLIWPEALRNPNLEMRSETTEEGDAQVEPNEP